MDIFCLKFYVEWILRTETEPRVIVYRGKG